MYIEISNIPPSWPVETKFFFYNFGRDNTCFSMVIINKLISLYTFSQINRIFRIHSCFR